MQHFMTRTALALAFLLHALAAFSQISVTRDRLLCPGEIIFLGGNAYNAAGNVVVTIPGIPPAPDTIATYRLQVLSSVTDPDACNCHPATFYKTFGSNDEIEFGTALTRTADGNLYFAGRKGSQTFIQKINPSGELIWEREFVINAFLPITPNELIEDSEGMIVGCGAEGQVPGFIKGFIFKYNPNTNQLIWAHEITGNNPNPGGIFEKTPGGNYIYYQTLRLAGGETDPEVLEIERTTGNTSSNIIKRYQYQSADVLNKMLVHNGALYGVGSSALALPNLSGTNRSLVTRLNFSDGAPVISKLYPQDSTNSAFFGRDVVPEGNARFIIGGDGRDSSGTNALYLQGLAQADWQLDWVYRYDIGGRLLKVLSVADGYVVLGEKSDSERFIFKTAKTGEVLWAKKVATGPFGGVYANGFGPSQAVDLNGSIMFTGIVPSGNYDAFLLKIAPDGSVADSCGILENISIPFSVIQNPINVPVTLTTSGSTTVLTGINTTIQEGVLFDQLVCPNCVPINLCPEGNDFVVEMRTSPCSNGGINLQLNICDLDGGALPTSMNVAFYDANPTTQAATSLGNYQFFTNGADSCATITLNNLAVEFGPQATQNGFQIFAVVNFDGVLNTPFTFADFPVTDLEECDYTNNIDSFTVDIPSQPTLDLGPDRSVCAGTTVQIDAGSDFFKYKWSTGAASQKIVVTQSGDYRVTVTDNCGSLQFDTIHVEIKAWPTKQVNGSICPGETFTYNNRIFTGGGFFADTLATNTAGSCDTVVSIFISQLPYNTKNININFCPTNPVVINGVSYSESGLVRDTVDGTIGCDTIILYVLSERPRPFRFDNASICPGGSITIGGVVYTQPGTYFDTIPSTSPLICDTILNLALTFMPQVVYSDTIRFCPGYSVTIDGQAYTQPGTVTTTIPGMGIDCDTLFNHILEWLPAPTRSESIAFCQGSSVTLGGQNYTQPGTVNLTIPGNGTGCDTLVTYTLSWLPTPTRSESIAFCQGASVTLGGQTYTQPGTVTLTVPGNGGDCDSLVTYTLSWLPTPTRSETIEFCQGTSVTLGGQNYTQPGVVTLTVSGNGNACDTIVTYTLQYLTPPQTSNMSVKCPDNLNVATIPGSGPQPVNYTQPTVTSDCICPGSSLHLDAGLASGALFPVGVTNVCYTATDRCNSTASCCFKVTVREELPCDTKTIGCLKYDILSITSDPSGQYTYKVRVTNNCAAKLIYTAIEIPDGVVAVSPANNGTFTSSEGRSYAVRNPNYSPFYSVRFKSVSDSIFGGQSEVFEYTLPEQTHPTFIHIVSRVAPQTNYEAILNTFNCPIGVTPPQNVQNRSDANLFQTGSVLEKHVTLFPNPTGGDLYADCSQWNGQELNMQVLDGLGRQVQTLTLRAQDEAQRIDLQPKLPAGLYFLRISAENGEQAVERFVIE
jgi:hypothetical protein